MHAQPKRRKLREYVIDTRRLQTKHVADSEGYT